MKRYDLKNQTFGRLTVIEATDKRADRKIVWKCQCSCGNIAYVHSVNLIHGITKSCGCLARELSSERFKKFMKENSKIKDITGQVFGRLTALEATEKRECSSVVWKCKCSCGNIAYVSSHSLTKGSVNSCGCLQKEVSYQNIQRFQKENFFENTNVTLLSKKEPNKNNKIGIRGVCFDTRLNKYLAYITFKKKRYNLGVFSNKEEATKIRKEAEEKFFGEFLEWYNSEIKSKKAKS